MRQAAAKAAFRGGALLSNRARLAWVMHMRHAHPRGRCSLVRVQSDRFTVTTVVYKNPHGDTVDYKTPHGDRLASSKRLIIVRHDHGCCGSTISDAGPFVSPDCQHRARITVGQVHPRPVQWSTWWALALEADGLQRSVVQSPILLPSSADLFKCHKDCHPSPRI